MKYIPLIILVVIFNSTILKSQNVSVKDYQVPVSQAQTLRLDGSYNWSQTGTTVTSNNANANMLYKTFFSSLPLAWFIDIDATGTKTFNDYTHNIQFDASFRKYIWSTRDWFRFQQSNRRTCNKL